MNSKIEIMGVLNITDNSFYDGGKFNNLKDSINHAKRLINDGADIIDIGAESSKPGSDPVSSKDQIRKIEPLVEALREVSNIPISIDTRSSEVINQLLKYKINIVNDISSLEDNNLLDIVKCNKLSISLMHMLGTPKTMQVNPSYNNVINDIYGYLKNRADLCINHGIDKSNIIIDPGFGFGKTLEHNYMILNNLDQFNAMGYRVLSGISRKSMIGDVINKTPDARLYGTLAASVVAIKHNTSILRVHDVRETKMLLNFQNLIRNS
jgi:dihydropteroate synthase